MSDTSPLAAAQAELEAAQEAAAERARLEVRLARADAEVAGRGEELRRARAVLADEAKDVDRLESFSPSLVWAVLQGTRDERLEAERAEQRATEYHVAGVTSALEQAERHREELRRAAAALGDVTGRRARALDTLERILVVAGHDGADELEQIAREAGDRRAELLEVQEVVVAAQQAGADLAGAARHLGSASSWAAFDTFGGGGLLTDLVKRQKMDEAVALMRRADESLRRLARELGDLGQQGVGGIAVDDVLGTFDVWFDNIFSDWSVMNRIDEARGRVRQAEAAVADVLTAAQTRAADVEERLRALAARREALLTGR